MREHVGVRMAEQAELVRDLDAAQDELAALDQRMDVIALPDAQAPGVERRPGRAGCPGRAGTRHRL